VLLGRGKTRKSRKRVSIIPVQRGGKHAMEGAPVDEDEGKFLERGESFSLL
jgi:hypothetical protein